MVWLIDCDGAAGQFWEALSDKNEQLNPQEYSLHTVSSKMEIAEEMPKLDITPERLEENRLKHEPEKEIQHRVVFDQNFGRYVCLHCGVDIDTNIPPHELKESPEAGGGLSGTHYDYDEDYMEQNYWPPKLDK